jgi:hypothetical protein
MIKNKSVFIPAVIMTIAGLALATSAFAQTTSVGPTAPQGFHRGMGGMMGMRPGVVGTVAAVDVNGVATTFTVTAKQWQKPAGGTTPTTPPTSTTVTYTVDASNATVTKAGAASSVSDIAVGDTVMISGTVSGTNVTATTVRDGVMQRPAGTGGQNGSGKQPTVLNPGNGQPVVAGAVTAISGNIITITNKSDVTYTVDATNAKIQKGSTDVEIGSVSNNDNLVVQGTVNGTSVTASTILDQGPTPAAGATGAKPQNHGFFGMIGNFFSKIFGF